MLRHWARQHVRVHRENVRICTHCTHQTVRILWFHFGFIQQQLFISERNNVHKK